MTRSRSILLFLCLLLLTSGCQLWNGSDGTALPIDSTKPPKLLLNGKPLVLSPAPILVQGKLQLPFKALMDTMKIPYSEYRSQKFFTATHENRYVRIDMKAKKIFANGKRLPAPVAPAYYNGTAYVPSEILFSALNLQIQYPSSDTVAIQDGSADSNTTLIDGEYFVPVNVPENHIRFMVPKSWVRLPGSPYRFGQTNTLEDYSIRYDHIALKDSSLKTILGDAVAQQQEALHASLREERRTNLVSDALSGISAAYVSDGADKTSHVFFYVLGDERDAYVFIGQYTTSLNTALTEQQISEIARSIRTGDVLVDTQREHYVETPRFIEDDFQLSTPLWSNMEVFNQIALTGTTKNQSAKTLYAVVTRSDESLTFQIPIQDGKFQGVVDTPFGIGKHDVILYASSSDTYKPDDRILQFSVVNDSRQVTRWLIPSPSVNTRDEYITSQSNLLSYKANGDYAKARNIFKWILDGTQLIQGDRNPPHTSKQVYLDNSGTEREICYLYAALLRAAEIPAKVLTSNEKTPHYWVELQINGPWVDSDPVLALQKQNEGTSVADALNTYFSTPKAYYEEKYRNIETLQD